MIFGYDTSSLLLEFSDRDGFYRGSSQEAMNCGELRYKLIAEKIGNTAVNTGVTKNKGKRSICSLVSPQIVRHGDNEFASYDTETICKCVRRLLDGDASYINRRYSLGFRSSNYPPSGSRLTLLDSCSILWWVNQARAVAGVLQYQIQCLVNLSVALMADILGLACVSLLPRDCIVCLVRIRECKQRKALTSAVQESCI